MSGELAVSDAATSVLSMGYFFEPTPLPAQTASTNLWDNPRHAVSCGYVLRTSTPLPVASVGFAMQRHFLVPRVHHKRDRAFEFGGVLADVESRGGIWVGQVELEAEF